MADDDLSFDPAQAQRRLNSNVGALEAGNLASSQATNDALTQYGGVMSNLLGQTNSSLSNMDTPLAKFSAGLGKVTRGGTLAESMSNALDNAVPEVDYQRNQQAARAAALSQIQIAKGNLAAELAQKQMEAERARIAGIADIHGGLANTIDTNYIMRNPAAPFSPQQRALTPSASAVPITGSPAVANPAPVPPQRAGAATPPATAPVLAGNTPAPQGTAAAPGAPPGGPAGGGAPPDMATSLAIIGQHYPDKTVGDVFASVGKPVPNGWNPAMKLSEAAAAMKAAPPAANVASVPNSASGDGGSADGSSAGESSGAPPATTPAPAPQVAQGQPAPQPTIQAPPGASIVQLDNGDAAIRPSATEIAGNNVLYAKANRPVGAGSASATADAKAAQEQWNKVQEAHKGMTWDPARGLWIPTSPETSAALKYSMQNAESKAKADNEVQEVQGLRGTEYVPKGAYIDAWGNKNATAQDAKNVDKTVDTLEAKRQNPPTGVSPAVRKQYEARIDQDIDYGKKYQQLPQLANSLNQLQGLIGDVQTGAWTEHKAEFISQLKAAGFGGTLSLENNKLPGDVEAFLKEQTTQTFDKIREIGGRVLQSEIIGISRAVPSVTNNPESNRFVIANGMAANDYMHDYIKERMKWAKENPEALDSYEFDEKFQKEHSFDKYVNQRMSTVYAKGAAPIAARFFSPPPKEDWKPGLRMNVPAGYNINGSTSGGTFEYGEDNQWHRLP